MTSISIIWDAVTVKNAAFEVSHDGPHENFPDPTEFFVQHNNTTILRGYYDSDNEPVIMNMLLIGRTQSCLEPTLVEIRSCVMTIIYID